MKIMFLCTSGFNFRFLYKIGSDRKVDAVQTKKNFENRFINSNANKDYVGGGGEEEEEVR